MESGSVTSLAKEFKNIVEQVRYNARMIINATTMVATMVMAGVLGIGFWWLAARYFTVDQIGIASTAVAAMLLLGEVGVIGFSTMVVGEIPKNREEAPALIATAVSVVFVIGGMLGILFALIAPLLSSDLSIIGSQVDYVLLFALGVGLTSVSLVVDLSTVGLNRGEYQLWRNAFFSVVKLVLLFLLAKFWIAHTSMTIYAAWAVGALIALALPIVILAQLKFPLRRFQVKRSILKSVSWAVIGHHILNLSVNGPGMLITVMVTILLSATYAASFYVSWMTTSILYMIPLSLSTSLYAVASMETHSMAIRLRFSLGSSLLIAISAILVIFVIAGPFLSFFNETYAEQSTSVLRVLSLSVLPYTIMMHYVAIARVYNFTFRAARLMIVGCVLQLTGIIVGGLLDSPLSISLGLVISMSLIALAVTPTVLREANLLSPSRMAAPVSS